MNRWVLSLVVVLQAGDLVLPPLAPAAEHAQANERRTDKKSGSIAGRSLQWPSAEQWRRVALFRDYNTRVVVFATTVLGCAAGLVGSFTLLRKRALMGDALSHATLPGICIAYIAATLAGIDGKSLPILLAGATATGVLGVGAILAIRNLTRLKEDAALGAVLSVFFGGGIALVTVINKMNRGEPAGLESFIYGRTASLGAADAYLIAAVAAVCLLVGVLMFKELKLLCFDEGYAGSRGFPVITLDLALMALVVLICIVGLQAVGLILMIALLVIPAAAARFWTEKMRTMAIYSTLLGGAGGFFGAAVSALFYRLPSGAMIVLVCTLFFLLSMVFGTSRGMLARHLRRRRLNRSVDRQHLLRAMFELLEDQRRRAKSPDDARTFVTLEELMGVRSWSMPRLIRSVQRAETDDVIHFEHDQVRLTEAGKREAARLTRQHRLWELYLIHYAEIAPSRVDREADAIEHVLEPEVVAELEKLLDASDADIPTSPHETDQAEETPLHKEP